MPTSREPRPAAPPTHDPLFRMGLGMALLLLALAIYYGHLIASTRVVHEGRTYFCLVDDTMVSMRYARNLAAGSGLVWNPGEKPVEGFSNPLWVLWMTAFHLLPIPAQAMSLPIQISGAILLLLNLIILRALVRLWIPEQAFPAWMAVLLTATYAPLVMLSLEGMEISLCVLVMDAALLQAVRGLRAERFTAWPYLFLGAGLWVRLDMAVGYLSVWAALMVLDARHRARHARSGLVVLGISAGVQTMLRAVYFGDLIPNTYYLKMTGFPEGVRMMRGIMELLGFLWDHNLLLMLLPFVLLLRRPPRGSGILASLLAGQAAYHIWAGGDIFMSRFLIQAMPVFFVLFGLALQRLRELAAASRFVSARAGFWLVVPLVFPAFNGIHDAFTLGTWAGSREAFVRSRLVTDNTEHVQRALDVNRVLDPRGAAAVSWAGVQGYFIHARVIDILGKTDAAIARLPARVEAVSPAWKGYYPGHMKWSYPYSIGKLKPDLVLELWKNPEEARALLDADYVLGRAGNTWLYSRRGSRFLLPNILHPSEGESP